MKHFFNFIFLIALATGCKPKELSGIQLENKLKETIKDYLDTTLRPGVIITVKDVNFYTEKDKKLYDCEFHVNMHYGNKDTLGTIGATITNDFSKVERTQ